MKKIKMVAIAAPSGGGKGTSIKFFQEKYPDFAAFSVSVTSRQKSESENEGEDYFFVSRDEFEKLIKDGHFLEYEKLPSGDYYGTPKSQLEKAGESGKILFFDIDVKGASKLKDLFGDQMITVFIDSGDNLESYELRIRKRGRSSDTEESIKKRLGRIPFELEKGRSFDCVLMNNSSEERFLRLVEDVLAHKILGFPLL